MANVIGFDPVAWSVDGGEHPASLLRKLAYAATQGSEGIVTPLDCRVRQLTSAGPQVRIDTGAVAILNRSTGGAGQTYIANAVAESRMDIDATTGSARSDLVVVRVEDPEFSPWPTPDEGAAPTYQYTKPFIIKNVPASTTSAAALNLGYSAYALARIDIPSNTTNITTAMIKDLRKVARPRYDLVQFTVNPTEPSKAGQKIPNTTSYVPWPTHIDRQVFIPSWAAEVTAEVILASLSSKAGGGYGYMLATLGENNDPNRVVTSETAYDFEVSGTDAWARQTYILADTKPIPAALRGTSQRFHTSARRITTNQTSTLEVDIGTTISVKLWFKEVASA